MTTTLIKLFSYSVELPQWHRIVEGVLTIFLISCLYTSWNPNLCKLGRLSDPSYLDNVSRKYLCILGYRALNFCMHYHVNEFLLATKKVSVNSNSVEPNQIFILYSSLGVHNTKAMHVHRIILENAQKRCF